MARLSAPKTDPRFTHALRIATDTPCTMCGAYALVALRSGYRWATHCADCGSVTPIRLPRRGPRHTRKVRRRSSRLNPSARAGRRSARRRSRALCRDLTVLPPAAIARYEDLVA